MSVSGDGLPRKPRLHRSYYLVAVPDSENLLLYREGRGVQLKPHAGSTLLARLLDMLDGSQTVQELVDGLGEFDPELVLSSLASLQVRGLLEDASLASSPASVRGSSRDEQRALFSHLVPDAVEQTLAALADAVVLVIGSGAIATALAQSLDRCGVGVVRSLSAGAVAPAPALLEPATISGVTETRGSSAGALAGARSQRDLAAMIEGLSLVVAALDHPDPNLLEAVNSACLEQRVALLPVVLVGWEGQLGPTSIPGQTACVECASIRAKSNLSHYQQYLLYEDVMRRRPGERPFGRLPHFPEVLAGIAATEVVKTLTSCYPATTHGRVLVIDLLTSETETHDVLRVPRCPACSRLARRARGQQQDGDSGSLVNRADDGG